MTAFAFSPRPPWTWACLACGASGTGSSDAHRCRAAVPWILEFWRYRLRAAALTTGEVDAMLAQPVARAEIVRILGDRWRPEHTAPIAAHAGVRKEAA